MEPAEKILGKAYELFKRYGVRSVTMDEIAGHAGVSKKTVYQYFEDKDSLVEKIIIDFIEKSEHNCITQTSISDDAIHEMFLTLEMIEHLSDGMNPAVMFDLRKYHNAAYARIQQHQQRFMFTYIKNNIERGISEGTYRDDLDLEIIVPFYLNSMSIAMDPDIFPKTKYTIAEIHYQIMLFMLNGLASPAGLLLIEKYKQTRHKLNTV